ncbi:hypothetical protein ACH5RR_021518 [Cinchona calisaya]|uniref:Uncharacterized protein n=1 Tax=Cinchona calisaya TaxID=153742 RepID=A0ABD2ZIJ2_9GENT
MMEDIPESSNSKDAQNLSTVQVPECLNASESQSIELSVILVEDSLSYEDIQIPIVIPVKDSSSCEEIQQPKASLQHDGEVPKEFNSSDMTKQQQNMESIVVDLGFDLPNSNS